jgi:ubiquitin C-terminal hydrolase
LAESIKEYFKDEEIDEYRCDSCNGSHPATISHSIIKTPPYLSITINRFTEGFQSQRKDGRTFTLDDGENLDLSSVITDDIDKRYSLMSVIDHMGSARGGHYLCHIKHIPFTDDFIPADYNGPKHGSWYLYDDDSVYDSSSPNISQASYMLFFRRMPKHFPFTV